MKTTMAFIDSIRNALHSGWIPVWEITEDESAYIMADELSALCDTADRCVKLEAENKRLKALLLRHSNALSRVYYAAKDEMDRMQAAGGSAAVCGEGDSKTTKEERDRLRACAGSTILHSNKAGHGMLFGSAHYILRLLDDADRLAEFEAYCAAYKTTPEDIREAFAVMDGKPTRAALEAENERLRDGISDAVLVWADSGIKSLAILRALLDGG